MLINRKIKNKEKRLWYAQQCVKLGWSKSTLNHQIDLKLYERQVTANKLTNFKNHLPKDRIELANEIIKDPYIFELQGITEDKYEKDIEKVMLGRIKDVLLELGKGFSFIGNQYKVSTGNNDYYIDLLFYHLELRCYIVVN